MKTQENERLNIQLKSTFQHLEVQDIYMLKICHTILCLDFWKKGVAYSFPFKIHFSTILFRKSGTVLAVKATHISRNAFYSKHVYWRKILSKCFHFNQVMHVDVTNYKFCIIFMTDFYLSVVIFLGVHASITKHFPNQRCNSNNSRCS